MRITASGRQQATEDEVAQEDERSLGSIMVAIRGLRGSISLIDPKLDAVTVEVILLQAYFGKISEKVKVVETHIEGLLLVTKRLEEQVWSLTKQSTAMAARLEDQEGRASRNNISIVRVSEGMEGQSVELFVEDLVLNTQKPRRLSNFFTVEAAHRMPGEGLMEYRCTVQTIERRWVAK
ncbi:hypothetical protein NDU88_006719 [Pleurodeles waltl]|uniref:Uncharacterized protein n=1 Tax=Pleurodeles waltl TaxID=8319 RepID=A0AAV7ULT7_PLEWA|nr:hypothetical protein NDU88_006719 [Pleurodeles waltl]